MKELARRYAEDQRKGWDKSLPMAERKAAMMRNRAIRKALKGSSRAR